MLRTCDDRMSELWPNASQIAAARWPRFAIPPLQQPRPCCRLFAQDAVVQLASVNALAIDAELCQFADETVSRMFSLTFPHVGPSTPPTIPVLDWTQAN